MTAAPKPPDEAARLAQLRALALLDSYPEERFDRITRLAQRLFDVPIALVTLVDEDRQWFKSRQGLDVTETPREAAFCAHAILGEEVMQVPDSMTDERFATNPLVVGDPNIRFYAGCPIEGPGGAKLGTLCVIDREPRQLTDDEVNLLRDLAQMVEREIAAADLATGDDLTGLANRRGFDVIGARTLALCRNQLMTATLIYLDLDDFKEINDRLGHQAGDEALREFSAHLLSSFRGSDLIARVGGDEFAVLLINAPAPEPAIVRLQSILATRNAAADARYSLLTSVGVAFFDPRASETLEQLAARADAAMYLHKHAGQDRTSGAS
ncbi:MAG: sensor domain-containing diguanylate cyclase [Candidatus Limnocylindrales bacterium]